MQLIPISACTGLVQSITGLHRSGAARSWRSLPDLRLVFFVAVGYHVAMNNETVDNIASKLAETVPEGLGLGYLAETISKSKYNSFPVVNTEKKLVGILSFFDYSEAIFNEHLKDLVVAKDLATLDVVTVSIEDNLYEALEKISRKDFAILPVVSHNDPSLLVGVLSRRDIIGAYDKAIIKKSLGR